MSDVTLKAVGYVRVSQVRGRGGESFLSPELQREQIEAVAGREGLRVVEVIEELDASGGDSTRPGWNRAIEMVESGQVKGICVWNLSRFSRSTKDAIDALERIEAAGGRVYSATEQWDGSPMGRFTRDLYLNLAQMERERAAVGFDVAKASAVSRGVHMAGKVPLGYSRDASGRLHVDPDTAPVVQGMFERKAKGESVQALVRWLGEQGVEFTGTGVRYALSNRTYRGEVRSGQHVKEDAHPALVTEAQFRRAQGKGVQSQRTGRLAGKFLLGGIARCAECGSGLRLSTGGRNHRPFYYCRNRHCAEHAYAGARELDTHVLNVLDERINPADPSQWVAKPGGDDAEVAEAEAALEDAKADLDGYLADTTLRRVMGEERYAEAVSNYVAVADKCAADLEAAREATSGGLELVGRLWNTEWGNAERAEWLGRMVREVVVRKGREALSRRVEVELR